MMVEGRSCLCVVVVGWCWKERQQQMKKEGLLLLRGACVVMCAVH